MHDLFETEEKLLQKYQKQLSEIPDGGNCPRDALAELIDGYARVLRQLRTLTRHSDKTTENLHCAKQDLIQKIHHDTLTGVYSRRYMNEKMRELCSTELLAKTGRADRVDQANRVDQVDQADRLFCVMMVDVDYFKKYNDIYGHPRGDACLKEVARALSETACAYNGFVARYGGEEFAVVLTDTSQQRAQQLGKTLLQVVSEKAIPHAKNHVAPHVTVSIGCVTGVLDVHSKAEDYIAAADRALYQSKQNGRNRISYVKLGEAYGDI